MFNFIRKLKKKSDPVLLEQTGVSFSTSFLEHLELFRKNTSKILAPEAFYASSGQYLVRDGVHTLMGHGATGEFTVRNARALALVFIRHPYSGTVRIWVDGVAAVVVNLNAPFTFAEPIPVAKLGNVRDITVKIEVLAVPRHASHCNEALLWRLLVPCDAAERKSNVKKVSAYGCTAKCQGANIGDEDYYTKVNQEQFDAWDRHVVARGYTLEEGNALVSDFYYKRLDKAFSLLSPRADILDIGCGFCSPRYLDKLLARYNVARYCGHDISKKVVEQNSQIAIDFDSTLGFTHGLNTLLPYSDNSFSFVHSGHCLEHSDNILQTFSEIRRVLQPGGILHFFVPLAWDESPEHIYYFNPLCWALLGEKTGMSILSVSFGPHYNPLQDDWDTEIIMEVSK